MTDLLERLETERDLCANEHADDIAKLLDDAITEIERLESQCATHQMNQTNLENENRNMARLVQGKDAQVKAQSVELAQLRGDYQAAVNVMELALEREKKLEGELGKTRRDYLGLSSQLGATKQELEHLRAERDEANRLIAKFRYLLGESLPHIDSHLCASVWKTGSERPHHELCKHIRAALDSGNERDCETCKNYIPNASWSICKLDYADSSDCASGKTNRYERAT